MRKIIKTIIILIVVAGVVFAGYYAYNNYFCVETKFYNAIRDNYSEKLTVKGTINTINSAEIYSKSTNVIKEILVKEGDEVITGAILAYLDDDKTHELEKAELNYNEAKRNFELIENLYKSGDVSEDQYIKTQNAMNLAKVAFDSLEIEDDLVVKSPIDGVVTKVDAKLGMVAGGLIANRLFQIDDISKLRIKVEIKEKDLYKVKVGQRAHITSDAMGDRVFYGNVSYISQVGEAKNNDNTKKFINAYIDIDENEKNIIAGVSARADIIVNEYEDVLIVPIDCLVEEVDASYVNVLKNNEKTKLKIEPIVIADDEFIIKNDGVISTEDKILGVE